MGWNKCDFQEIILLKQSKRLELPWDYPDNDEPVFSYDYEGVSVAYIRVSVDPIDKKSVWIDEFEVIREYRKKGIGKKVISEFVKESTSDILIMAKNRQVQIFWEKCGFEDNGITWTEIPMIYKVH